MSSSKIEVPPLKFEHEYDTEVNLTYWAHSVVFTAVNRWTSFILPQQAPKLVITSSAEGKDCPLMNELQIRHAQTLVSLYLLSHIKKLLHILREKPISVLVIAELADFIIWQL